MTEKLDLGFVLIPAGDFLMGSNRKKDRHAPEDEMPQHKLSVTDYYIMRYPVTNDQYAQFVAATNHRAPLFWREGQPSAGEEQNPVVGVAYNDALAFCRWAAQETGLPLRLPTEPEWEKAARGPDGRLYPWGDQWEEGRCNSSEAKIGGVTPVGQFSPAGDSPYGVGETAGNVQEWISSLYGPYPYDATDGREVLVNNLNPSELLPKLRDTGCTMLIDSWEAALDKSMLRGGSFLESKFESRCAYRSWAAPMHRSGDTGFRCVYEQDS
ncbi:MAG TPA: SUMF1/EgtB/PvdO family nonheme iron enzyme [Anaerolineales bacterium]|nr:SUMF1/EgtB/PvdO family nonheme iron enzyme [Anaerolineales bacterium]